METYCQATQQIINSFNNISYDELVKKLENLYDDLTSEIAFELFDYFAKQINDHGNYDGDENIGAFLYKCIVCICKENNLELVRKIYEYDTGDNRNMLSLMLMVGADAGNFDVLKYHKENYPEPDTNMFVGAFAMATNNGNTGVIEFLVNNYPNISLDRDDIKMIFGVACRANNIEMMDYLYNKFQIKNMKIKVKSFLNDARENNLYDVVNYLQTKFY